MTDVATNGTVVLAGPGLLDEDVVEGTAPARVRSEIERLRWEDRMIGGNDLDASGVEIGALDHWGREEFPAGASPAGRAPGDAGRTG